MRKKGDFLYIFGLPAIVIAIMMTVLFVIIHLFVPENTTYPLIKDSYFVTIMGIFGYFFLVGLTFFLDPLNKGLKKRYRFNKPQHEVLTISIALSLITTLFGISLILIILIPEINNYGIFSGVLLLICFVVLTAVLYRVLLPIYLKHHKDEYQ